jgi:putrescine transport system substrate-binding protein
MALRRPLLAVAGSILLGLVAAGCGGRDEPAAAAGDEQGEPKVLNVSNWSDYIDEDVLAAFKAEYGIDVNYDVFDSNEVLETKLLAGASGYDVVVPSANFLERQIRAGVFRELDKSRLGNLANLDADILERVARHDPGNAHAVVYMWGTTGIGYDAAKVRELAPDAPTDSWRLVLDPDVASRLAPCGISVLDDPTDMASAVLAYRGRDPNGESDEDLAIIESTLLAVRPFIRKIHSSQYIDDLANGEVCVAVGYSGDVLQARDRASEAGVDVDVRYSVPVEGTIIWFDMLAIPADAPHPGNAHLFIDYLMRPEVAAANTNYVHYANPNAASLDLVDAAIRDDPGIYPPPEVRARLAPNLARSEEFTRKLNRVWTRFTTGT